MLNKFSIRVRLLFIVSALSALAIVLSVMGLVGINNSNDGLKTVYLDRLIPMNQLYEIKVLQLHNRTRILSVSAFSEDSDKYIAEIKENIINIEKLWRAYMATKLTDKEVMLAAKFEKDRNEFEMQVIQPALNMMEHKDENAVKELILAKLHPMFKMIAQDIDDLVDLQVDVSKYEYENAQGNYQVIVILSIALLLLGLAGILFIVLQVVRNIIKQVEHAKQVAMAIANGELNTSIHVTSSDEIGVLLTAMDAMQSNLKSVVNEMNKVVSAGLQGDFSHRIDLSGKSGFIRDIPDALNKLSNETNNSLQDVIRVTAALSKGDLSQTITQEYKGVFAQTAKGINETVDTLTHMINDIQSMIDSAANRGDFSYKMNLSHKSGYTKELAELLNQLSDLTDNGLNDMLHIVEGLAEGDLTRTISKEYPGIFGRLKNSMNETTTKLQRLMAEIRETSDIIASAAKEIAAGNNDLSNRTEQQAASLEETATSMQQLTSTVKHNSENARQASELAVGATDIANKGVMVVDQVVSTMENINQSSLRIVDIISVIDDIAFQTNILALNAAVEAARAGEQGKGFAVVATEVRNLAQRAANAAGEIKRLIGDSVDRVSGGSKQVEQAGQTMQDILDAISRVNIIISEIASASAEQNTRIAQVGQAISSIDEVTQQNAALVEEVAAAAEALETQTGHLAAEMSHFKTGTGAKGSNKSSSVSKKGSSSEVKSVKSPAVNISESSISKGTFSVGDQDWEEF